MSEALTHLPRRFNCLLRDFLKGSIDCRGRKKWSKKMVELNWSKILVENIILQKKYFQIKIGQMKIGQMQMGQKSWSKF